MDRNALHLPCAVPVFFFGVFFGAERGAIELMEPNPIEQVHLPHMGYFMGIEDGL